MELLMLAAGEPLSAPSSVAPLPVKQNRKKINNNRNKISSVAAAFVQSSPVPLRPPEAALLCPVFTSAPAPPNDPELPELRAYKLGKQKCSYNQIELVMKDKSETELRVSEAIESVVDNEIEEELRGSCLKFNVRFINSPSRVQLYIFLVYASPYCTSFGGEDEKREGIRYHWMPVTRSECKKGCTGPVIRGLQRFGRMSRRSGGGGCCGMSEGASGELSLGHVMNNVGAAANWKEPRHLYIAIDEASTHVCSRRPETNSKFRLLLAAYDDKRFLLGSAVSRSIRVLANNDAPLGAASFKLHCAVKGLWGSSATSIANNNRAPLQVIEHNTPFINSRAENSEILNALTAESDCAYQIQQATDNLKHDALVLEHAYNTGLRKNDKSFTTLFERIVQNFISSQDFISLSVQSLAVSLGTRKRRVSDILSALCSIGMVQNQEKERYMWLGTAKVHQTLERLKTKPMITVIPSVTSDIYVRDVCEKFLQVFLDSEEGYLSWEYIVETILGKSNLSLRASKVRKLCEIAWIFSSLNLIAIQKVRKEKILGRETLLYWIGAKGVMHHFTRTGHGEAGYHRLRDMEPSGQAERLMCEAPPKKRSRQMRCSSPTIKDTILLDGNSGHLLVHQDTISCISNMRLTTGRMHSLSEAERGHAENRQKAGLMMSYIDMAEAASSIGQDICDRLSSNSAISMREKKEEEEEEEAEEEEDEEEATNLWQQYNTTGDTGKDAINDEHRSCLQRCRLIHDSSSYCSETVIDNEKGHASTMPPPSHTSSFDPLSYLQMLFTPDQIAIIQKHNPEFLFNFVRYFRQFHHMMLTSQHIGKHGVVSPLPISFSETNGRLKDKLI